jgi:hypothetical protein
MKKAIVALARLLAIVMHRIGLIAPSSRGPAIPETAFFGDFL